MKSSTHRRALLALSRALKTVAPELVVSSSGYVGNWVDNLVPGIEPKWFEADLAQGDGRELEKKFKAAHSSSALVVNSFARFKPVPSLFSIGGYSGFDDFQFEAKCPAGIRGRRPPNLDLLAKGGLNLGVGSKCTEHLRPHAPVFSPAYDDQIKDKARRDSAWFRLMQEIRKVPGSSCYFDAAQMVKHAFGLVHSSPAGKSIAVYLLGTT